MLIKWATGFIDFVTIRHPSPWSISVQVSACWLLQTKRKLQLFQIIEMHFIMSWKWPGTPRSPTAVLSNVHCYQGLINVRGYNEQPHRTAALWAPNRCLELRHSPLWGESTGGRWSSHHIWPIIQNAFPINDVIVHYLPVNMAKNINKLPQENPTIGTILAVWNNNNEKPWQFSATLTLWAMTARTIQIYITSIHVTIW